MLSLSGLLTIEEVGNVYKYTRLRFKAENKFTDPEALTLYEQSYLDTKVIQAMCENSYGIKLHTPETTYIPDDIKELFIGSKALPTVYDAFKKEVTAIYLPELMYSTVADSIYTLTYVPTPVYHYLTQYYYLYGNHPDILEPPPKQLIDMIIEEAIKIGAADITITTKRARGKVYFNVRKKMVDSNRIFSAGIITDVIKYICAMSPYDFASVETKHVSMDINKDYRARVVINKKYKGYTITIRLLPNGVFGTSLEQLNLTAPTVEFIKDKFLNKENGLRLIVGSTMSGKNTTALSALKSLVDATPMKVISVEFPVEQELEGVEQIDCEDMKEYLSAINALIRHNSDFVYITEMNGITGDATMKATNIGTRAISTMHVDVLEEFVVRLTDICNMSSDRVLLSVHSVIHQTLVRDDITDTIRPVNEFVYLGDGLKDRLLGKEPYEIVRELKKNKMFG